MTKKDEDELRLESRLKQSMARISARQEALAELCLKVMGRCQDLMKLNMRVWDFYKHNMAQFEKRMESMVAHAMLRGISI
jgi:hypothetical protein